MVVMVGVAVTVVVAVIVGVVVSAVVSLVRATCFGSVGRGRSTAGSAGAGPGNCAGAARASRFDSSVGPNSAYFAPAPPRAKRPIRIAVVPSPRSTRV